MFCGIAFWYYTFYVFVLMTVGLFMKIGFSIGLDRRAFSQITILSIFLELGEGCDGIFLLCCGASMIAPRIN